MADKVLEEGLGWNYYKYFYLYYVMNLYYIKIFKDADLYEILVGIVADLYMQIK